MKSLLILFLVISFLGCNQTQTTFNTNIPNMKTINPSKSVRKAVVSGHFYPENLEELKKQLLSFFPKTIRKRFSSPKALIVPHAGYSFSGQTAAHGFAQLIGSKYKRVFILGPSHHTLFSGASILDIGAYETPFGQIEVSQEIVQELLKDDNFDSHPQAHEKEHSIEVELPFLQAVLPQFELVPIIIGADNSFKDLQEIAKKLKKVITDDDLVIISTDFTHYGANYDFVPFDENIIENIQKLDEKAFRYLIKKESENLFDYIKDSKVTIDGGTVLPILTELFPNAEFDSFHYTSSGEILGEYDNSVSYASFGVYDKTDLSFTEEEKDSMLAWAYNAVDSAVAGEQLTIPKNIPERLKTNQGVFVTLEKEGDLRGCIGSIQPKAPIWQLIVENAKNAALNDPRFDTVSESELDELEIEVSVLSVPKLLEGTIEEKIKTLEKEKLGVVLQQGENQATYLPQVWEQLPEVESFLSKLSKKARLPEDAWKNSNTHLYVYSAVIIKE